MNVDELNGLFKKHGEEEFSMFERVENKRSKRSDLHAFLLLDKLCATSPNYHGPDGTTFDMISAAEHDQIWVCVGREELAAKVSEAQIIELIRCGLRLDDSGDGFTLFV